MVLSTACHQQPASQRVQPQTLPSPAQCPPAPPTFLSEVGALPHQLLQRPHPPMHGGIVEGGAPQVVTGIQVMVERRQARHRVHVAAVGGCGQGGRHGARSAATWFPCARWAPVSASCGTQLQQAPWAAARPALPPASSELGQTSTLPAGKALPQPLPGHFPTLTSPPWPQHVRVASSTRPGLTRVQRGELVVVPGIHLVPQLLHQHLHQLHPALLRRHVHGRAAL